MSSSDEIKRCEAEATAFLHQIHEALTQTEVSDVEKRKNIEKIRDDLVRWKEEASNVAEAFSDVVRQQWGRLRGRQWHAFFQAVDAETQLSGNKNEKLKRMHLTAIKMYWSLDQVTDYGWEDLGHTKMQHLYKCAEKWYPWPRLEPIARLVLVLRQCFAVTNGRPAPPPEDQPRPEPSKHYFLGSRLVFTVRDLQAIRSLSDERQEVYGAWVTTSCAAKRADEIDEWTTNEDGSIRIHGHALRHWRPRDWPRFLLERDDHGLLRQRRASKRPALTPAGLGIASPPSSTARAHSAIGGDVQSASGASSGWPSDRSTFVGSASPSPKLRFDPFASEGHRDAPNAPDSVEEISAGPTPPGSRSESDVISEHAKMSELRSDPHSQTSPDSRRGEGEADGEGSDGPHYVEGDANVPPTAAIPEESEADAASNETGPDDVSVLSHIQPLTGHEAMPPSHDISPALPTENDAGPNTSVGDMPVRVRSSPTGSTSGDSTTEAESLSDWHDRGSDGSDMEFSDESDAASGDESDENDRAGPDEDRTTPQLPSQSFSPHTPTAYSGDPQEDLFGAEGRLWPPLDLRHDGEDGTTVDARGQWWERYDSEDDSESVDDPLHSIIDGVDSADELSDDVPLTPRVTPRFFPALMSPEGQSDSEHSTTSIPTLSSLRRSTRRSRRTAPGGVSLRLPSAVCHPSISTRAARVSGASFALHHALSQVSISGGPSKHSESGDLVVPAGTEGLASRSELGGRPTASGFSNQILRTECSRPMLQGQQPWSTATLVRGDIPTSSSDPGADAIASASGPSDPSVSSGETCELRSVHQPSRAEFERHLQTIEDIALGPQGTDVCVDRWHLLSDAKPASIWAPEAVAVPTGHAAMASVADADVTVLSVTAFMAAVTEGAALHKPVLIQDNQTDGGMHSRQTLARGLRERFGRTLIKVRRLRATAAEVMSMNELVDLLLSDDDATTSLALRDRVRAQMPAMVYLHRFDLLDVALMQGGEMALPTGLLRAHRMQDARSLTEDHIETAGGFRGLQIGALGGRCLRVLEGRMLCVYIPRDSMTEDEWKAFGRAGSGWRPQCGHKRIMLKRNEQLFLPAGTVSAAYALDACVSMEVPVWDRLDLLQTLRAALRATQHPRCATGASIREVPWAIDGLESLVQHDVGHYAGTWRHEEWWTQVAESVRALRHETRPPGGMDDGAPQRRTASSPPSAGPSRTEDSIGSDKRRRLG